MTEEIRLDTTPKYGSEPEADAESGSGSGSKGEGEGEVTPDPASGAGSTPTAALQPRNPLHGVTLEAMVTELVDHYGWIGLGERIQVNSFTHDPSVRSSLKFLRRTPWAREKVESLYLFMQRERARSKRR